MNTNNIATIFIILLSLFSTQIHAQDGYTYTLLHDGGYNFTVQAVPNASANNFATSVQSYGFTILLPDGVTITPISSLGSGASTTFFDGTNVAQPTIDGYLVTETLGSPATLAAPSAGTNSNMFSFTVNGNPSSGELKILENNAALATTVTPLKSFMQADMVQSIAKNELSLYPNPVNDVMYIGSTKTIHSISISNMNGQLVKKFKTPQKSYAVTDLQTGIYLVTIKSEFGIQILKLVKN